MGIYCVESIISTRCTHFFHGSKDLFESKMVAYCNRSGILLLGAGNYLGAEGASEDAYTDPTDRDVFYEQTFGLFSMSLAAMALSTGLFVKGRGLAMLTMISSVAVIIFFVLHYNAGEVVEYGYNNLAVTITLSSILGLMGIGGYLHLEDE